MGARMLSDGGTVHKFFQAHLLHWLEALSLMQKTSEGVLALISLNSMVVVSDVIISKEILTNILRVIKVPAYRLLFVIQNDSLYITDQQLKRLRFNYIALLSSSHQK